MVCFTAYSTKSKTESLTNSSGFHQGITLYRGYFNGTATGVFLNIQGGTALYDITLSNSILPSPTPTKHTN